MAYYKNYTNQSLELNMCTFFTIIAWGCYAVYMF